MGHGVLSNSPPEGLPVGAGRLAGSGRFRRDRACPVPRITACPVPTMRSGIQKKDNYPTNHSLTEKMVW